MSFKQYIKEQEEQEIVNQEQEIKDKISDFFKNTEDLTSEKFNEFVETELDMDEEAAEEIVFNMLRDMLLSNESEPEGDEGTEEDYEEEEIEL